MGVVHLYGHMLWQGGQIGMLGKVAAQDVLQSGGCQEIFLLQAQFLALIGGVIGVENAAKRARQRFRFRRSGVITPVKALQIKESGGFCFPQTQGVGPFALPADNRRIMCGRKHRFAGHPNLAPVAGFNSTFEADGVGRLWPLKLPRVALI